MNASATGEQDRVGLVEIVELKWLLSGEGMHVHVEKLQSDPAYACQCLQAAEASANPALRQLAARLRPRMPVLPAR